MFHGFLRNPYNLELPVKLVSPLSLLGLQHWIQGKPDPEISGHWARQCFDAGASWGLTQTQPSNCFSSQLCPDESGHRKV